MQLKNIERLVKRTGTADLIYTPECVWIDNGFVKAPLFNFSSLNDEQFYSVFNIEEKKRNDYVVTRRRPSDFEAVLFNDAHQDEEALTWDGGLSIHFGGVKAVPMLSERGVIYLDARDMTPFLKEDANTIFHARWREDEFHPTVAAKSGLLLKGLLQPIEQHVTGGGLCDVLENLWKQTRQVHDCGYVKPEVGE